MRQDDGRVPALLLSGGSPGARDAAIARLAEPVAGGHPVAVLRAAAGMFAGEGPQLGAHVVVKRTAIGCLCCTAGVVFRVALFGLLHASRPARLIVDLGPGAHVATLESEFQGDSLSRAVRVVGRIDLDAAQVANWPQ